LSQPDPTGKPDDHRQLHHLRGRHLYERIFRLEEVEELAGFVNAACGAQARMPRLQTGGAKLDFFALDEDVQLEILEICRNDVAFQLFPDYWEPYAHLLESETVGADALWRSVTVG
jgi:hypothetical protein